MLSSTRDIAAIRARVKETLDNGAQIDLSTEPSKKLLRRHVNSKIGFAVLYVDIDGSTRMSMALPSAKFASILQVFSQEMSLLISESGGYTLKYVGDAVISLFPGQHDKAQAIKGAIECGKTMLDVVASSINPELVSHSLPPLKVKIAIEYGELLVLLYGRSVERAHIDVIGPAISMAAKMLGFARTDQIIVGESVFEQMASVNTTLVETDTATLSYLDEKTGLPYRVHILR